MVSWAGMVVSSRIPTADDAISMYTSYTPFYVFAALRPGLLLFYSILFYSTLLSFLFSKPVAVSHGRQTCFWTSSAGVGALSFIHATLLQVAHPVLPTCVFVLPSEFRQTASRGRLPPS
jgi:hypothetical protein